MGVPLPAGCPQGATGKRAAARRRASGQRFDGPSPQVLEVVGLEAEAAASVKAQAQDEEDARVAQPDAPDFGTQTEKFVTEVGPQGGGVRPTAVPAALRGVEPQGVGVERRRFARFVGRRSVAARQRGVGKFVIL